MRIRVKMGPSGKGTAVSILLNPMDLAHLFKTVVEQK
jgi:hypothetical protein